MYLPFKKKASFFALSLLIGQHAAQITALPNGPLSRALDIAKESATLAVLNMKAVLSQTMQQELATELTGAPAPKTDPLAIAKSTLMGLPQQIIGRHVTQAAHLTTARLWKLLFALRHTPQTVPLQTVKQFFSHTPSGIVEVARKLPQQLLPRSPWDHNKEYLSGKGIGLGYQVLSGLASKQTLTRILSVALPTLCISLSADLASNSVAHLADKAGLKKPEFLKNLGQTKDGKKSALLTAATLLSPIPLSITALHSMVWGKIIEKLWIYGTTSNARQKQQKLLAARQQAYLAARQGQYPHMAHAHA